MRAFCGGGKDIFVDIFMAYFFGFLRTVLEFFSILIRRKKLKQDGKMENIEEHQIETQCMQDLVEAHQFYFEFATRKIYL